MEGGGGGGGVGGCRRVDGEVVNDFVRLCGSAGNSSVSVGQRSLHQCGK